MGVGQRGSISSYLRHAGQYKPGILENAETKVRINCFLSELVVLGKNERRRLGKIPSNGLRNVGKRMGNEKKEEKE